MACGDDDASGPGAITRVEIFGAAETDTLGVDGAVDLQQIILDAGARTVSGAEYAWTSSDDEVATVDELGVVTAVNVGSTVIRVEAGGLRDSVMLTVVRTELRGGLTTIVEGSTTQFTAALVGPDGDIAGQEITFESSDEEVLEVSEDGLVTAVAPGTAEITATWSGTHGDVTDTVEVTVIEDEVTIPPVLAPTVRR